MKSTKQRGQRIDPFWNRIPQFFVYGLRPLPLLLTLGLAFVTYVFTNIFVLIFVYAMMVKYCLVVLDHSAEGRLQPPPLDSEVLLQNYNPVAKQVAIFILFGFIIISMGSINGTLALLTLILGLLMLPASVMVLATTESLTQAMNPLLLARMIGRIGWSYLGLYGLLLIVSMAEGNLQGFLATRIPKSVLLPTINAVNLYFSVMMFHMMGYVLYQHHDSLGFSVAKDEGDDDPISDRLGRFRTFMEENKPQAAKAELESLLAETPDEPALQEKYCTMLKLHGTAEEKQRFAGRYLSSLFSQGRHKDAARVYVDCVTKKEGFALADPQHYLPLMRMLCDMGKPREAVLLTGNCHLRFPNAPEVAEIYLESARILSGEFNRDNTARKLLSFVIKNYPQHPVREEAEKLLQLLQAMS